MPAIRLLDLADFAALSPTKQFFNGLLGRFFSHKRLPAGCRRIPQFSQIECEGMVGQGEIPDCYSSGVTSCGPKGQEPLKLLPNRMTLFECSRA